jgi:hypothetical protein
VRQEKRELQLAHSGPACARDQGGLCRRHGGCRQAPGARAGARRRRPPNVPPSHPPPQCRLCWDPESAPPGGLLLSPCRCKGTSAFIHANCLQRWLDMRPGRGACDICRAPYDAPLLADVGVRVPPPPPPPPPPGHDLRLGRALWWQQLAAPRGGGATATFRITERLMGLTPFALAPGGAPALGGAAAARRRRAAPPPRLRWWRRDAGRDPLFWSGLLHGAWRAAVALDGAAATLALLRHRAAPGGGPLPAPVAALLPGWAGGRRGRRGRRRPQPLGSLASPQEVQASFDATTIWQVCGRPFVLGQPRSTSGAGRQGQRRPDLALLQRLRRWPVSYCARAALIPLEIPTLPHPTPPHPTPPHPTPPRPQVQLYSSLIALSPRRAAAAEACSGMALGAIIGGCLSSVAFLPLVGLPRLAALSGACRLAAAAGARLGAGLACRPEAHRKLAEALARGAGAARAGAGAAGRALRAGWRRLRGGGGGSGAHAGRGRRDVAVQTSGSGSGGSTSSSGGGGGLLRA